MKSGNRSNALLVELLIVIMFFMLSATFLMQVFSAARNQGEQADAYNRALVDAQNLAEQLYAAEDPEDQLGRLGFASDDGIWQMESDGLVTEVTLSEEAGNHGMLRQDSVTVYQDGKELITLPVAKYVEAAMEGDGAEFIEADGAQADGGLAENAAAEFAEADAAVYQNNDEVMEEDMP